MLTYNDLINMGFYFIRLPKGKIQCEHPMSNLKIVGSMLTIRKKLSYER